MACSGGEMGFVVNYIAICTQQHIKVQPLTPCDGSNEKRTHSFEINQKMDKIANHWQWRDEELSQKLRHPGPVSIFHFRLKLDEVENPPLPKFSAAVPLNMEICSASCHVTPQILPAKFMDNLQLT